MTLDQILNDTEKAKLTRIAEDDISMSAIKKIFLFGIYYNGTLKAGENPEPTMNFALALMGQSRNYTDEHLGQVFRAQVEAISQLEAGFKELEKFKIIKSADISKKNEAR